MITDWEVKPIWLECIISPSEHHSYIIGMVLGRVKVGVVTNGKG
jgi:hypothetical protein